jgi:hypothetical protein
VKTLTPSLVAAQRASSSRPFVRARFQDFQGDRPRLRPVRHYTGGEASGDHAVLVTTAGTLLRARTTTVPEVRVNRVPNASAGSNFATDTR